MNKIVTTIIEEKGKYIEKIYFLYSDGREETVIYSERSYVRRDFAEKSVKYMWNIAKDKTERKGTTEEVYLVQSEMFALKVKAIKRAPRKRPIDDHEKVIHRATSK